MAGRDLMVLNGDSHHSDDGSVDGQVETVIGAGRVGTVVATYEEHRRRIIATDGAEELRAMRRPEEMPVSRQEAVRGMQDMEHRAAQAIAGAAAESAQAVNVLAQQTATAVGASQQAVSTLHTQTAQAFSTTEEVLGSMQDSIARQEQQLKNMQAMLQQERNARQVAERKAATRQNPEVTELSRRLEEALTRIDELSADLATANSLANTSPAVAAVQSATYAPVNQVAVPQFVPPPHLLGGEEITAPVDALPNLHGSQRSWRPTGSRDHSHHSRHSRRSRSPLRNVNASQRSSSSSSAGTTMARRDRGIFDVEFRPKDPPTFSGRTNEDPEIWIGAVSNFFRLVGGSAAKQVAYASTLLHGAAQTWWQRKLRAEEEPWDWPAFADQLLKRFQNTNKSDSAMANLMNIRQKKEESTHDFICRFEAEMDKVESYDESWLLKMFIWGLPQDQAVLVSQKRPRTLSQAFQLARDAALAAQMARRPGGGKHEETNGKKNSGQGQKQQSGKGGRGAGNTSKIPNNVYYAQQQRGGFNRGRGQAGRQPGHSQVLELVHPSNQRQPSGSGQRGRGRGNQRRPRVAALTATDNEGMAGQEGQEAAQHAAMEGTDASLRQGQGN